MDRRELFVDAPDVSKKDDSTGLDIAGPEYTKILYERAGQELIAHNDIEQFDGQADTTNGFVYRTDFNLGDIVQIENEYGITGRSRITEVTISENLSGKYIYPTFETL